MTKFLPKLLVTLSLILTTGLIKGQSITEKTFSVDELFEMVRLNHPTLKVYRSDLDIADQQIKIAKNQLLPQLTAGAQAFYLGDITLIDKDFSSTTTVKMPHFGNTFSLQASQLVWKGNSVRNSIKIRTLQQELAELDYQANEQNIKLLVLGYYLDLSKLYNQEGVYRKNIDLAVQRLANIKNYHKQGMVTRNDVIRGELQLSNLKLALQVIGNNKQIINKQLTVALGLDEAVRIVPSKSLTEKALNVGQLQTYEEMAQQHPSVRLTRRSIDVYDVSAKITKAEMVPSLGAFASNNLQRPLTSASPAVDMFSNSYNAGVSISFNIDALFKSPKKLQLNRIEKQKAIDQANNTLQSIDVAINAAYIKYNEAVTQNKTLEVNADLTNENYRIMESKYNNQLAILLDLLDASNAKLDAELQLTNSEISIVFSYYKLLKEAGNL
ncbi:MAG: TolC family protein [Pedobacter sp.]|uniref:TolC family protein n=1 Tax=Pedobacter sp. TaxID=1411316 RepID=UPI0035656DE0